jgi:hypothetical protein
MSKRHPWLRMNDAVKMRMTPQQADLDTSPEAALSAAQDQATLAKKFNTLPFRHRMALAGRFGMLDENIRRALPQFLRTTHKEVIRLQEEGLAVLSAEKALPQTTHRLLSPQQVLRMEWNSPSPGLN